MGSDLEILKSHPDKLLLEHVQGVKKNVQKLTDSKIAELVAISHDLGKINPNFQDNFKPDKKVSGYAHHAYLSAFAFFCYFSSEKQNFELLKQFVEKDSISQNDFIALIVSIAKHHGNLPDFTPVDHDNSGVSILSKNENVELYNFLKKETDLPIQDFFYNFFPSIKDVHVFLTEEKAQKIFSDKLKFRPEDNTRPLNFFLETQFAFASVLQADKADAGKIGDVIDNQLADVQNFSSILNSQLELYLNKLKQDTELNRLRTTIRNHAVQNIKKELSANEQVFELTAPTGSGKTLMMLSLASEIVQMKGVKRIIYALPFLSITEQVENEVFKIFEGYESYIQRIDSKTENQRFEKIQKELDGESTEDKLHELNILEFQENTFAYPFIITTFVRFFETLLSNRNAELLKLPNFANCIFLLDEIQTLPPRLYGFFIAYLKKFCQKFNSYAIISTATQPNFSLPEKNIEIKNFFNDYINPKPLLSLHYFENNLFNRYKIEFRKDSIDLDTLKEQIISENSSVLVILNTIDDTKELFAKLREECDSEELLLLNTHFTPRHRKIKIYLAKRRLRQNKQIIVISTQLIEAGVDIDFPILYRDFATVASIVQSAGRCNRNGKLPSWGKVVLFKLEKNGKLRSEIIYQGKDKEILRFTKESLTKNSYQEKDLLQVQREFFNRIQSDLNFARYGTELEDDFLKDIKECMFEKIDKFQLIDEQVYGEEMQFYIPQRIRTTKKGTKEDAKFEELLALQSELINLLKVKAERSFIKQQKNRIELHLKKMSNQIVQIRLKNNQMKPCAVSEYFSLNKIDLSYYSFTNGIDLQGGELII